MLLQAISGLVTVGMVALSAVVGVRLLRLGRGESAGAVRLLGLYFLLHGTLALALSVATYVGWSSAELELPDRATRALNAGFFVLSTIGVGCLLAFTQRTFRPASATGRSLAAGLLLLMIVSVIVLGVTEGFEVRVVSGPAYWVHFGARVASWVWVAVESFAYWGRQQRRLALGLTDPIVTNRFFLWGLWGALLALLAFADPIARLWYVALAGSSTTWIPELGRPVIAATLPVACALNLGAVVLMLLTFFPTRGYRRWIVARHTSRLAWPAARS